MGKTKWKKQWRHQVRPTRLPGVWKMQEGGYIARRRVTDPTTGRQRELKKVFSQGTERDAFNWLEEETTKVREGLHLAKPRNEHFADYAVSLFERKVAKGELKSSLSRDRWRHTLPHLIRGIDGPDGELAAQGFGELFIDKIRPMHVETWKEQVGPLIQAGHYSPNTVNGWWAILRAILRTAAREYELPRAASDGVRAFDTTDHVTYAEEEPNALTPEQVPLFLEAMMDLYPQHYAMTYLGIVTGLRPSTLRPLRRGGAHADFLPKDAKLYVRRSAGRGQHVLNRTKQKTRYPIALPADVVKVLKWHIKTQLKTDEQLKSELLFPSINGLIREPTVLNKPMGIVSDAIELGYRFTQRGMRRTFNDLARRAKVEMLVAKSISGHKTDDMVALYSTVGPDEQRQGLAEVLSLIGRRKVA